MFLSEEQGFGVGVGLKIDRARTEQIDNREGGRVAQDSVP